MAVAAHYGFVRIMGSFYRMERLVRRFCISVWSACSAWKCPCNRKSQPSGEGRISVLSASGSNDRMPSGSLYLDWNHKIYDAVRTLYGHQFSGPGGDVYLPKERYIKRISKEIENVKYDLRERKILMLECDYEVKQIDGDYAHLQRIDRPEEELKLVARALLPMEIYEGCILHYEMMQYSMK